jgi:hypothetical protein
VRDTMRTTSAFTQSESEIFHKRVYFATDQMDQQIREAIGDEADMCICYQAYDAAVDGPDSGIPINNLLDYAVPEWTTLIYIDHSTGVVMNDSLETGRNRWIDVAIMVNGFLWNLDYQKGDGCLFTGLTPVCGHPTHFIVQIEG